jgi:hypothetical protein
MLVSCSACSSDQKIEATGSSVVVPGTPSPEAVELDDHIMKTTEPAPNKCSTDGNMATLTVTLNDKTVENKDGE